MLSTNIKIINAEYGTLQYKADVTNIVKNLHDTFKVSNENMGCDPLPGIIKTLYIHYIKNNVEYNVEFREHSVVIVDKN